MLLFCLSLCSVPQADQEEEKGHVKGRAIKDGKLRKEEPGSPATKIELADAGLTFAVRKMLIN